LRLIDAMEGLGVQRGSGAQVWSLWVMHAMKFKDWEKDRIDGNGIARKDPLKCIYKVLNTS
jgi:hypothetical protein